MRLWLLKKDFSTQTAVFIQLLCYNLIISKRKYINAQNKINLIKRPELVKTSQNTKKDWSKRPHKTFPFFKGDFSKKCGILTKKKLILVSAPKVWKFENDVFTGF